MTSAVCSIIRGITRLLEPERKLNIILFSSPIYEAYNYQLAKTGHNFYLWTEKFPGQWRQFYLTKPDNVYHLPPNQFFLDLTLDFDFIITHNRILQHDIATSIANALHLPIISIHHNDLQAGITDDQDRLLRFANVKVQELLQRVGSINVYDTDAMMMNWQSPGSVIPPGIDVEQFENITSETQKCIIPIIEDQTTLNRIMQALSAIIPVSVLNPAWSEQHLIEQYKQGDIFINLNQHSIDLRMLEAMAAKCVVISRPNAILNSIFENGKNIIYIESENALLQAVQFLLQNPKTAANIKQEALKIIQEKFNINTFIHSWQQLFEQVSPIFYVR